MKKNMFTIILVALVMQVYPQSCEELFISEYVEGWSNNKAIELYNPTSSAIDLSDYRLVRYSNGLYVPPPEQQWLVNLEGTIAPYRTFVIVLDKRDPNGTGQNSPVWDDLQDRADVFLCPEYDVSWTMYFNGDDALTLEKSNGTVIDIFGKYGEQPLNEYGTTDPVGGWSTDPPHNNGQGVIITRNHTMFRTWDVAEGVTENPEYFDPMAEYDTLPVNTFTNLNWHECVCMTGTNEKPEFSQNAYEFSILPGSPAGTEVGTITATDPDADVVEYFIVESYPGHPFMIDRYSGTISVEKPEEITGDMCFLTIDATDGTSPVSVNVTVSISQNFDDLEFGTDSTLDVVTWNIEHFPKSGSVTTGYVSEIIQALEADVVAIQEIEETDTFYEMLEGMENYDGFTMTSNPWDIDLGFIYNTEWVQVISIDSITSYKVSDDPFPRKPLILEILFMNETYFFINNHLKAGGDGYLNLSNPEDEETRRYNACYLLDEYISAELNDEKVIVLGDLNDELIDEYENNVFRAFFEKPDDYLFADMAIAEGPSAYWSFPNTLSHIDHLLITSELFDEFESQASEVATLILDEYFTNGWLGYYENISDHRPVALKLMPDLATNIPEQQNIKGLLQIFPNPAGEYFSISENLKLANLEIYNLTGQLVRHFINPGSQISVQELPQGVYIVIAIDDDGLQKMAKMLKQ